MNTVKHICESYLHALERGDTQAILALFADDAQVSSPLYGTLHPAVFYDQLLSDTTTSKLTLHAIIADDDIKKAAIYFNYKWTLDTGIEVDFDVVDIVECTNDMLITRMTIIYDTVDTRDVLHIN